MRIALISTPFLPVPPRDYGGTELVVHELAEGLAARGHAVTLYATGDSASPGTLHWLYPEAQWPPDPLVDLAHVSWALRAAGRGGFDIVHAHSPAALALAHVAPGLPLVYSIHHARDERLSRFYQHFLRPWYIAISADQLRHESPLPRMTVIHHGLDPARFEWSDRPADYVCFLGRLSRVKGPHTAIDVAARAGLAIRLGGEAHPPDREFARAEVEPRLRLPHVTYLGVVGGSAKIPLLRDARALLAPIEWNEPFGLILIEAMLSGCPVVAFRRGSVPELVEHGVTGLVVDNAEQMAAVLRPGGPLDRLDRRRCRARAIQRFSRMRMVEDHERLYARVTADRAAARGLVVPTPAA
ncbi:MAG TPA: glycosyltransferase family 4 protein [Gemmatimonadales bacterium]|nr:glycosyltransferase family 4 protein [Gemmatimonadales bacterium]